MLLLLLLAVVEEAEEAAVVVVEVVDERVGIARAGGVGRVATLGVAAGGDAEEGGAAEGEEGRSVGEVEHRQQAARGKTNKSDLSGFRSFV